MLSKLEYKQFTVNGFPVDTYILTVYVLVKDDILDPVCGVFFTFYDALFNKELASECGVSVEVVTTKLHVTPHRFPQLFAAIKNDVKLNLKVK